jgi:hypothetical protein
MVTSQATLNEQEMLASDIRPDFLSDRERLNL